MGAVAGLAVSGLVLVAKPAQAQVTAFKQAVAEAAWGDEDIATFYRQSNYAPIWTGEGEADRKRRSALIDALSDTYVHALPSSRYDVDGLMASMRAAKTTRDMGFLEVELSRAFLKYARDVQNGILIPRQIDPGLVREVLYRDRAELLTEFSAAEPFAYMDSLPPQTREYSALMKSRLKLERLVSEGGWGATVPGGKLKPGQTGDAVIALRNRLQRMGYMGRSATRTYDSDIETAVADFQRAHGLEVDGVAGDGTIKEINVSATDRLRSVLVAMERERWLNREMGDRHILVNLADFHAKIVDHGAITFQTRSVVGKNTGDRRSPEFSDVMEHMIINPSWHVPRSIITKEYLPQLRNNPHAAGHLIITDARGRRVDRNSVDFSAYSSRNFPFDMRQPPSNRNALGLVKFMFPNKHNIYLHDTPQKALFKKEVRAYSHGCIRLADPFDFAYELLSRQEDQPKEYFQRILKSGSETKVPLNVQLPVHLIYRTAFTTIDGRMEFRRDVYGRDAKIWNALTNAGVALSDVQG
ncbi:MAG: murein L,D-transpeptidase [Paracoccaceae bacterium]